MVELWIDGHLMDLNPNAVVAVTKQINDFSELKNRRSTFTNSIDLPMTQKNIKTFKSLGIFNSITMPYKKLNVMLRMNGMHIINNGIGIIRSTSFLQKKYIISIYDGNKHFFQAIENKKIADLPLGQYNHDLTTGNFQGSFSNTSGYIYGISDFGNTKESKIEINYQLPSIYIKTIWDLIHSEAGFSPDFEPPDDLVLTPMRGWDSVIDSTSASFSYDSGYGLGNTTQEHYIGNGVYINDIQTADSQTYLQNSKYIIPSTQNYRIRFNLTPHFHLSHFFSFLIYVRDKNGNVSVVEEIIPTCTAGCDTYDSDYSLNWDAIYTFERDSEVFFSIKYAKYDCVCTDYDDYQGCLNWDCPSASGFDHLIFETIANSVSRVKIKSLIGEMSQKDFIKQIIQMYALMNDVSGNSVKYKKAKDVLKMQGAEDWSEKFVKVVDESYSLPYAKSNIFAYEYAKKDDYQFADGVMSLNNDTLPEEKTVIKSKFRATEKSTVEINGKKLQFIPFWEAVRDDSGAIKKYKVLNGKNYIAKVVKKNGTIHYGTHGGVVNDFTGDYPVLDFSGMLWEDLIADNYQEIKKMLDFYRRIKIEILISEDDFATINFFKLKYFKQLGAYFYLTKIKKSSNKKTTVCEFNYVNL